VKTPRIRPKIVSFDNKGRQCTLISRHTRNAIRQGDMRRQFVISHGQGPNGQDTGLVFLYGGGSVRPESLGLCWAVSKA